MYVQHVGWGRCVSGKDVCMNVHVSGDGNDKLLIVIPLIHYYITSSKRESLGLSVAKKTEVLICQARVFNIPPGGSSVKEHSDRFLLVKLVDNNEHRIK